MRNAKGPGGEAGPPRPSLGTAGERQAPPRPATAPPPPREAPQGGWSPPGQGCSGTAAHPRQRLRLSRGERELSPVPAIPCTERGSLRPARAAPGTLVKRRLRKRRANYLLGRGGGRGPSQEALV